MIHSLLCMSGKKVYEELLKHYFLPHRISEIIIYNVIPRSLIKIKLQIIATRSQIFLF